MSTLKVNTIRHTGASSDAVTLATDGTCTAKVTNNLSNRNLLINGEMTVAQRSTSAVDNSAATSALEYETIDRWGYWANAASVFSIQQVADSPADFQKSLKVISLGARSIVPGDYYMVAQGLEGQNIQHLNWGTANAKDCTLSFHVKSSLTGTFTGYLHGTDNFKPTYVFTYTISSADTWEKKEITITAPGTAQAGDFGSAGSNTKGLEIGFNLGVGTTYATSSVNQWTEGFFMIGTTSSVDVVATNAATWQVTGVQLEVGHATDFEHRSYGDELRRCQRYYWKSFPDGTTPAVNLGGTDSIFFQVVTGYNGSLIMPMSMRTDPTCNFYNPIANNTDDSSSGAVATNRSTSNGIFIEWGNVAGNSYTQITAEAEI